MANRRAHEARRVVGAVILLCVALAGCSGFGEPKLEGSGGIGPVEFSVDSDGNITRKLGVSFDVGLLRVGLGVKQDLERDEWLVIFRDHRRPDDQVERVFKVESSDELVAVVDGVTTISFSDRRLVIDTTGGSVRSLRIEPSSGELEGPGPLVDRAGARWHPTPLTDAQRRTWIGEVAREGPGALVYMMSRGGRVPRPSTAAQIESFVRELYFVFDDAGDGGSRYIDPGGFRFWVDRLAGGVPHEQVALEFAAAAYR